MLPWMGHARRYASGHQKPNLRVWGYGGGKYTHQTPTRNDLFQGTMPVFGISTREIPTNTKEILRLFRLNLAYTNRKKNERQLGFKWRLVYLFLVF